MIVAHPSEISLANLLRKLSPSHAPIVIGMRAGTMLHILKAIEGLGVRPPIGSDSLQSLVSQGSGMSSTVPRAEVLGLSLRPFG